MKGITRYLIYALLATGLLLAALLVLTPHSISRAAPRVLYAAPGGVASGNCNSWANACTLQYALSLAQSGDEIWVKKGVHYPGPAGDRTATFALKSGVALYGGFAGTESSRDERDWQANPTVLSGDIDQNDITDANGVVTTTAHIRGENAYHVVTAENVDSAAVLDGFIITAGKADGPYPYSYGGGMYNSYGNLILTNVTFSGNSAQSYGGGMYNYGGDPTLTNVTFCGNSASGHGGGMYNDGNSTLTDVTFSSNSAYAGGGMSNWYSDPVLLNVIFRDNSASAGGGGMFNSSSSPTLTNVAFSGNSARNGGGMFNDYSNPTVVNATFSGNSATEFGGGMSTYYLYYSPPTLKNVIMWGNSAPRGAEIYRDETCNPIISYSDIRGCGGSSSWNFACGVNGGGNIDADPLFVDAAAGNLRLRAGSPAIDAGLNSAVPAGITSDLDGNPRFVDFTGRGTAIVDMGAYEVQRPLPFRVYLPLVMRNR